MRILITGSREIRGEEGVVDGLSWVVDEFDLAKSESVIWVHGSCPRGADDVADRILNRWGFGTQIERHPAVWYPNGTSRPMDRSAGLKRNSAMVKLGADFCIAFPHVGFPCNGTTDCATKAWKAGIRVMTWPVGGR